MLQPLRPLPVTRSAAYLATALVALAGCADDPPCTHDLGLPPDLVAAADLAAPLVDLGKPPADLAVPPADMVAPPADMVAPPADMVAPPADMAGPHVTGLPACTDTGVTADTLFSGTAMAACASGGCHATGSGGLTFTSGATLKANTVGVAARQTTTVKRVEAGSVDGSYLMYKLTNQQTTVGGSGRIMPPGGRLSDAQLCKFITWIKEGAK